MPATNAAQHTAPARRHARDSGHSHQHQPLPPAHAHAAVPE
jgi:hypothetical protein